MCSINEVFIAYVVLLLNIVFKFIFLAGLMKCNVAERMKEVRDLRLLSRYGPTLIIIGLKLSVLKDLYYMEFEVVKSPEPLIADSINGILLILGMSLLLKKYYSRMNVPFKFTNPFILW